MIRTFPLFASGVLAGLLLSLAHGCADCPPLPPKPVGNYTSLTAPSPELLGIRFTFVAPPWGEPRFWTTWVDADGAQWYADYRYY